jgi:predicted TIM-barrel fold metal-dependent hydrolase
MTKLVDAHLHQWDLSVSDYAWLGPQHGKLHASFGPAEAGRGLAVSGIDGAVLVRAENSIAGTQHLLDIAAQTPWVLGVVGWRNSTNRKRPPDNWIFGNRTGSSAEFATLSNLVHSPRTFPN